jgi:hypothetical protein
VDRLCGLVVSVEDYKHRGPGFGHSLGFFWESWVWNGFHSASWSDKLSSYLNKEVTVRFRKLKMQLWDSMCWPHVSPVPSGAVGKDCQRRLLSRPRLVRAVAPRIIIIYYIALFSNSVRPSKRSFPFRFPYQISIRIPPRPLLRMLHLITLTLTDVSEMLTTSIIGARLHGAIIKKAVIFILAPVRTWELTSYWSASRSVFYN